MSPSGTCGQCVKNKNEKCVLPGDEVNEWIQKIKTADGIILSSPVHYSAIAGTMKSFLDRAFYVTGVNDGTPHPTGIPADLRADSPDSGRSPPVWQSALL